MGPSDGRGCSSIRAIHAAPRHAPDARCGVAETRMGGSVSQATSAILLGWKISVKTGFRPARDDTAEHHNPEGARLDAMAYRTCAARGRWHGAAVGIHDEAGSSRPAARAECRCRPRRGCCRKERAWPSPTGISEIAAAVRVLTWHPERTRSDRSPGPGHVPVELRGPRAGLVCRPGDARRRPLAASAFRSRSRWMARPSPSPIVAGRP